MAIRPQYVRWALERPCPMRDGDDWTKPQRALDQLGGLRTYSRCQREGDIFANRCILSRGYSPPLNIPVPVEVVSVETLFAPYGGFETVTNECRACEANTNEGGLAGCCGKALPIYAGSMLRAPDHRRADEHVGDLVSRLGLEDQIHAAFPATQPLWYGLWIDSPLKQRQIALLAKLTTELIHETPEAIGLRRSVSRFRDALQRSFDQRLPLHVAYDPPVEYSSLMGYGFTLAHCPRCKAGRNRDDESASTACCSVCNHKWDPRDTQSWRPPAEGSTTYDRADAEFIERYLRHQGYSDDVIETAIGAHSS